MTLPEPTSAGFFQTQAETPDGSGETPVGVTLEQLIAWGLYVPPTAVRLWTGGVTSTTLKANYDVVGTSAADLVTVGLAVSASETMSVLAYRTPDAAPVVTSGWTATYRTYTAEATGLVPDTVYYVAPVINGVVQTSPKARVRTAPAVGTPKSFNFIFGSCTNSTYVLGNPYAPAAALGPAFVVHCGDMDYSDIAVNDVRSQRDRNTRTWRNTPGVSALTLTAPVVYMPDDHDFGPDDNHWDMVLPTGATHAQIGTNTRQAVRETTPMYSQWDSAVLSQKWTWGRCRFILPDLRSQRRYVDGGPTFLGDGSDPPTGYDHITAILASIDEAAADGMKLLFFISTSTWAPAVYDSWERYAPAEQAIIAQKLRDSPVQAVILHGDAHQGFGDDGTYTDKSLARDGKVPVFCSSGWNWAVPFTAITDASWAAGGGFVGEDTRGNSNLFANVVVHDDGATVGWEVVYYGAPLSGTSATLLRTFSSDDADIEVGFRSSSSLAVPTGEDVEIRTDKTWFGPYDNCSATYTWASGPTGTITFTPNRNTALIPRAFTSGAPDTVTLSAPVRCLLGAHTTKTISYYTPDAASVAWEAELTALPSVEIRSAMNTFIAGLKTDGLWSKISHLYWLSAHNEADSLLNVKDPAGTALTNNGAGFAAMAGWRGGNVSGGFTVPHLDTGYAIPGGNQNSHAFFIRALDGIASFNGEFGGEKFYVNPYSTSANDFRTRSGSTASDSITLTTPVAGSFGLSRTASGTFVAYQDGASVGTITRTSTTPDGNPLWLCGFRNATTPALSQSGARRLALAMISSGLTGPEAAAYYARETTFLTEIGVL